MTRGEPGTDAAWVIVDVPIAPKILAAFCRNLERLYRINPYLEFHSWQSNEDGSIDTAFRNLSNQRDLDLNIIIERASEFDFTVRYSHGAKHSTRFEIEFTADGSRLRITDDYARPAAGVPIDPEDADKSLHAWGVALQTYLKRESRWGKSAIWRWYMRHFWLTMKPTARRISFIILMVTLVEVVLFVLVMTIYWLEQS